MTLTVEATYENAWASTAGFTLPWVTTARRRPGGGDIRVSHLMQTAYYGYSQHYANFPDEMRRLPPSWSNRSSSRAPRSPGASRRTASTWPTARSTPASTGVQRELTLAQVESRTIQMQSMMPDGVVNNPTPEGLADLIAYLQSLTGGGAP